MGAVFPPTSLTVNGGGSVILHGAEVVTTGAQAYGSGTLTVGAALPAQPPTLQGSQITSSGPVPYQRDLTIIGAGELTGPGSGSSCCSLPTEGAGTTLTLAGGGTAPDSVFVTRGARCDRLGPRSGDGPRHDGGTTTGDPAAPTAVTATPGDREATVAFTPGAPGCLPVSYTTTVQPGGVQATGSASPITVTGLLDWTSYAFPVTATNTRGETGTASIDYTVSAPPVNNDFKVTAIRSRSHGVVSFRLKLPGAGRIVVSETAGRETLARLQATPRRGGTVPVTVKLGAREQRLLKHRRGVKVRISVRYTPAGGKPRTVHLRTVTLKRP